MNKILKNKIFSMNLLFFSFIISIFFVVFMRDALADTSIENKSNIEDCASSQSTWDTQQVKNGTMMFLDVPFLRKDTSKVEYVTLSVAKREDKEQPAFMSIIVPNNVDKVNGVFIEFAKTVKTNEDPSGWKLKLENDPIRIPFYTCQKDGCYARVTDGYVTDEESKQQVNIYNKFMNYDNILVLFIYPDGSHKSVAIPLCTFKQQYKKLQ